MKCRMLLLKKFKTKAGSIIESVIAMTIIAICLSTALLIYARILDTDHNIAYYRAKQKLKELRWETKADKQFVNEDYNFETYSIKKEVTKLDNKVYLVTYTLQVNSKKEKYQYIVQ